MTSQAIIHVDADAFFASVEQALHPELKGKPVITGAERGMVIALSYEAKKFGVKRGMLVNEARKICPGLIFVPTDYEACGLFSRRMFEIMRRFTPQVEEYSIDEAFADITGMRRLFRCPYEDIAKKMKETIEKELGITVSLGLSPTKVLSKLASKFNKPSGLVVVPSRAIGEFLQKNTIDKVWGFGAKSVALLNKHGIFTVADFVGRPQGFAKKLLGKIGDELWLELSGHSVHTVNSQQKTSYQSISKFHTFSPASSDPDFVFAELLKNLERALTKMRLYHLVTRKIVITLRTTKFVDDMFEITLSRATSATSDLVHPTHDNFDRLFKPGTAYRATGVVLCDLMSESKIKQLDIFTDPVREVRVNKVDQVVDLINRGFGRRTVHLADTLPAEGHHRRGEPLGLPVSPKRVSRKRLNMPLVKMRVA